MPLSGRTLAERVASLEKGYEFIASREWVGDLIRPIVDSVAEIKKIQEAQAAIQEGQAEQTEELFAAHNELLKARAKREKDESETRIRELQSKIDSRTFKGRLKIWIPLLSLITSILIGLGALVRYGDRVLDALIKHYGGSR
jgi:hypothetical protein